MMQGRPVSDRYVLGLAWTIAKKDLLKYDEVCAECKKAGHNPFPKEEK